MAALLYREDMDEVRARLTSWWHGGDIGRPVMRVFAPRERPVLDIPPRPAPPGWVTDYATSDFDYRVYLAEVRCNQQWYLGEAVPYVSADLGPNCLALYLGCEGVEERDTVWFRPCITDKASARFDYDPDNFYWDFTERLVREETRLGRDKYLVEFPDLIEGLDTLAAMRGTQRLLEDLMTDPEWVHHCMRLITDRYFRYYDMLYDMIRDEVGGSYFWIWAPGRMVKLQCDFAAMIGPEMFSEFMLPVLEEMTERVSYSMFHWDGPGALPHLDALLSLPRLGMIQWVPGAGIEPPDHPRWWPLYHRILEAGKRPFVYDCASEESLRAMKREFGTQLNRFYIMMNVSDRATGERMLRVAGCD